MNNKQKYKILLNISIGSAILFLLLSFLAMFFYSGGSMINNPKNPLYNESILSYSHTYNFFSDLGLYTSWSGNTNSVSLHLRREKFLNNEGHKDPIKMNMEHQ